MATCIWISTSSNDFNVAANWSTGAVPIAGDTVVFDGTGTAAMTTTINGNIAFAAIYINQANAAQIGSLTAAGVATYWQHAATAVYIGQGTGNGSPPGSTLILMDSGATGCTYSIYDSASTTAVNGYLPPIQLKGSALTIVQTGGNFGVSCRQGETSTVASLKISQGNAQTVKTPAAYAGPDATITAFDMDTGTFLDRSTHSTATGVVNGGTVMYQGTGGFGTSLEVYGSGKFVCMGQGTIALLKVDGTFDHTADGETVTLTNVTIYKGAKYLLDNGVPGSTVHTNKPTLSGCGMGDVTWSTPTGDLV